MQDFSVSKCTRKCAISGRHLEPGENYYSVLLPDGESMTRIDIAASHWPGPQADAIGWWQSRMPSATMKKLRPAPNGMLLDTLSELLERPGQESLAYLLALLLIRRRVLLEEETMPMDVTETSIEEDKQSLTHWNLICPADGRQWNVPLVVPAADRVESLQQELRELLFMDE